VDPGVELCPGVVTRDQTDRLLRALESLPDSVWEASAGKDKTELQRFADSMWLDVFVVARKVLIPECLEADSALVREAVAALLGCTGCSKIARTFFNKFVASKGRGNQK
jgi:hypothetical protein